MIQICKFNPLTDIQASVEGLGVDIEVAMNTGVIADTGSIGEYNDIADASSVVCRVRDAFEAIDLQRNLVAHASAVKTAGEASASAQSTSNTGENV